MSLVVMIKGGLSHRTVANLTSKYSKRPTLKDQPLANLITYRRAPYSLVTNGHSQQGVPLGDGREARGS